MNGIALATRPAAGKLRRFLVLSATMGSGHDAGQTALQAASLEHLAGQYQCRPAG